MEPLRQRLLRHRRALEEWTHPGAPDGAAFAAILMEWKKNSSGSAPAPPATLRSDDVDREPAVPGPASSPTTPTRRANADARDVEAHDAAWHALHDRLNTLRADAAHAKREGDLDALKSSSSLFRAAIVVKRKMQRMRALRAKEARAARAEELWASMEDDGTLLLTDSDEENDGEAAATHAARVRAIFQGAGAVPTPERVERLLARFHGHEEQLFHKLEHKFARSAGASRDVRPSPKRAKRQAKVPMNNLVGRWKMAGPAELRCAVALLKTNAHNRAQLAVVFNAYAHGAPGPGQTRRIDARIGKELGKECEFVHSLCDAVQLGLLIQTSGAIDAKTITRRGGGARGPAPVHVMKRAQFVEMLARLALGCNAPTAVRALDPTRRRTVATRVDIVLRKLGAVPAQRAVLRRGGKVLKSFKRTCVSDIGVDERVDDK